MQHKMRMKITITNIKDCILSSMFSVFHVTDISDCHECHVLKTCNDDEAVLQCDWQLYIVFMILCNAWLVDGRMIQ